MNDGATGGGEGGGTLGLEISGLPKGICIGILVPEEVLRRDVG